MGSHIVTQGSIRCGHINAIDQKKCTHEQPCRLGIQPFQIVTEICKTCLRDKRLRDDFHSLKDTSSLLRYWYCRRLNEHRSFWGPLRLGAGVRTPDPENISATMEERMHKIWQEDFRRFVKLASCNASAVFVEGFVKGQGWCSADELDGTEGRALFETAMEMILKETSQSERSPCM